MNTFRRKRVAWTSRTLGLFIVAWLNVALQPCAMGNDANRDCPHCPAPQSDREHPCDEAGGGGACTYQNGYDYDGRAPKPPAVDGHDDVPPAVGTAQPAYSVRPVATTVPAASNTRRHPDGPPLNVLHCVYLK